MTHFSPQIVATVATRTSTSLPSISVRNWPSWGRRRLHDVHAGHDLDAADQPDAHGGRERQHLLEGAVDPVTDPDAQFGRLDVHVGGPVAHGLGQDASDDLDDRCIVRHDVRRQGRGVEAASPGALDGLEGLDEMVEAAEGPVVVLNGAPDFGQRREHRADGGATCLAEESDRSSGEGWSAIAT